MTSNLVCGKIWSGSYETTIRHDRNKRAKIFLKGEAFWIRNKTKAGWTDRVDEKQHRPY